MQHSILPIPLRVVLLILTLVVSLAGCRSSGDRERDELATWVMGAVQATESFRQAVETSVAGTVEVERQRLSEAVPTPEPRVAGLTNVTPTAPATATAAPTATAPAPTPFDARGYAAAAAWGTQGAEAQPLGNPRAIAVGADGDLFVLDEQHGRILRLREGQMTVFFERELFFPTALAVDVEGRLYVLEAVGAIKVISPSGLFSVVLTTEGCGAMETQYLVDLALGVDDTLLVADAGNQRVLKLARNGECLKTWGERGRGGGEFGYPSGIAVDNQGNIHVVDFEHLRVQKFDFDGRLLEVRGQPGRGETDLFGVTDIAIDPQGNIYLIDTLLHRVQKFDSNFSLVTSWWTYAPGAEQAANDHEAMVVGPDGRVYVTESNARYRARDDANPDTAPVARILVFEPHSVI